MNPETKISLLKDLLANFGKSKIGITKKSHSKSKSSLKMEKKSRKINRNKKRHHYTAKEKKTRRN